MEQDKYKVIKEVAEQVVGRLKSWKKKWYNEECREMVEKRRMAQGNYKKFNDENRKIIHEIERKKCKGVIQSEKKELPKRDTTKSWKRPFAKQYKELLQNYQTI